MPSTMSPLGLAKLANSASQASRDCAIDIQTIFDGETQHHESVHWLFDDTIELYNHSEGLSRVLRHPVWSLWSEGGGFVLLDDVEATFLRCFKPLRDLRHGINQMKRFKRAHEAKHGQSSVTDNEPCKQWDAAAASKFVRKRFKAKDLDEEHRQLRKNVAELFELQRDIDKALGDKGEWRLLQEFGCLRAGVLLGYEPDMPELGIDETSFPLCGAYLYRMVYHMEWRELDGVPFFATTADLTVLTDHRFPYRRSVRSSFYKMSSAEELRIADIANFPKSLATMDQDADEHDHAGESGSKRASTLSVPLWAKMMLSEGKRTAPWSRFCDSKAEKVLDTLNATFTPCHWAAIDGNQDELSSLMPYGWSVDVVSPLHTCYNLGWTPLHAAAYRGSLDTVSYLIKRGADPEALTLNHSMTPILLACIAGKEDIVEHLILLGVSTFRPAEGNWTPLHAAATRGLSGVTKQLLGYPGAFNITDEPDIATRIGLPVHYTLADLQLNGLRSLKARDQDGQTPLHLACKDGRMTVVRILLAYIKMGYAPFGVPAQTADRTNRYRPWMPFGRPIERLEPGLINAQTKDGSTALSLAAKYGYGAVVKELLKHGANVNKCDNDGRTPLMRACAQGHYRVVSVILSHGADIDATVSSNGFTALHYAARGNHPKSMDMLLAYGADTTKRCSKDLAPLAWSCQHSRLEMIKLLLKHTDAVDENDFDAAMLLVKHGGDIIHAAFCDYPEKSIDPKAYQRLQFWAEVLYDRQCTTPKRDRSRAEPAYARPRVPVNSCGKGKAVCRPGND